MSNKRGYGIFKHKRMRKFLFFFFFKQKTAYEISACLVGSEKACRDAGKIGIEGKEYVVQDGDIMHFLFNV